MIDFKYDDDENIDRMGYSITQPSCAERVETPVYQEEPTSGSTWTHHSGRLYTVLFLTNGLDRPDYPRTVVYVGVNGKLWSGPLSDWHRRMTKVGE